MKKFDKNRLILALAAPVLAIVAASERGLALAAAALEMANLEAATARHHYQASA